MVAVSASVPPPVTSTSPEETPSVIAPEIVVVVPEAMLNVGSPETVIELAMVVVPVTRK